MYLQQPLVKDNKLGKSISGLGLRSFMLRSDKVARYSGA